MKSKLIQTVLLAWLMAAGAAAWAQETNDATATDFHSFDIIYKRNIFDPSRSGRRPSTYTRPRQVDTFTLVGTMSYEKGRFAFFDGSSSEYRKTLKPAEKIAGYKIAEIAPDHIVLAAASNQTINLPVGTRMRRQDGGAWWLVSRAEPDATPTPAAIHVTGTPQRLRRRR